MISSDVGVYSRAAGKRDVEGAAGGGGGGVQYPPSFGMQPTVSLACLTHAAAYYNQHSRHSAGLRGPRSAQHQFNQMSFFPPDRRASEGKP